MFKLNLRFMKLIGYLFFFFYVGIAVSSESIMTVNGQPITKDVVAFLAENRAQGHLSESAESEAQLLEDLLTTELLFQAAIEARIHESPGHQIELELARKTLLSQLYVKNYISNLEIDDATLRAEYQAIRSPIMLQMQRWDFETEVAALAFLKEAMVSGVSPEHEGEAEFEPWQSLESFSFSNLKQASDLRSGDWLNVPVASQQGWQVWRCLERSEIEKPPFEIAREGLRQDLGQKRLQSHIDELKKRAKIVLSSGG